MTYKRINFLKYIPLIFILLFITGCDGDLMDLGGTSSGSLESTSYDDLITYYANKNDLPVNLVKAVVQVESAGNKDAVSSQGAMGLMQLMPETAKACGVKDPFSAAQNIAGGTKYLKQMVDEFKDYKLALAAYNAGPDAVRKYDGIPPYDETVNYVNMVMSIYKSSL